MTPAQLASIIRYHLGEMASRNGHHEFEHLSRYLARARVYSNILPATGPVGAGGDQGRDFETFDTHVGLPAITTFISRASDGAVAFACSLDKRIEPKIRSDIRTIVAGDPVVEVVYFCESSLPVARRHELQAWARVEFDLKLQIFDGAAIAEMLAERDVFWIAQEFLHIPAEMMPPVAEPTEWYAQHLDRWMSRSPLIVSNSDFAEIKWGLRHATFGDEARPRLSFWIALMERFIDPAAPRPLQRLAIYEVAVAHLRGKGDMTSQLDRIRDYYSDMHEWLAISDLQDAATLTSYSFGGWGQNQFSVAPAEIFEWRRRLQEELDRRILEAPGHGRKSGLLSIRGFLQIVPEGASEPPLDRGFDDWERMLDEAELTPLFPIEEFVDHLSKLTSPLGRHPRFDAIAERADRLLAKRKGPAVAAEKAFERALTFYEQDELLDAVRDLHRVHLRFFTGDSMARFQNATFILAKCYLELGLAYAAKNVALAGAFVSKHSDDAEVAHMLPTLLLVAADADDGAGSSISYIHMLLAAIDAHLRLDPDPLDPEKHPSIQTNIGQVAALRGFAARSGPTHLAAVDAALAGWPEPLREPIVKASTDPEGFWSKGTWDEVWSTLEENFIDRPFGGLNARRSISWRSFGVRWSATFDNDHRTARIAEEFVAELQTSLAALAGVDLCLLPSRIELQLSVAPKARNPKINSFRELSDPGGVQFAIKLAGNPRPFTQSATASASLAVIAEVLSHSSVLSPATLLASMKDGLLAAASRVQIARPYRELYDEFVEPLQFEHPRRNVSFQAERQFKNRENPLLAAKSGPGPTYSQEESLGHIEIRYQKSATCIGMTVRALMADAGRRAALVTWHDEGMRDWEILSIVANAANNIRHPLPEGDEWTQEQIETHRAGFDLIEDTALSPDLFTDEFLLANRQAYRIVYLTGWHLVVPYASPDLKAIEDFLIERYGMRSDDVDHADLFGWPP